MIGDKMDRNQENVEKTLWQKFKWWFNFISTIIMNSIIVILVLIGIIFLAYYIDVTKNVNSGTWKPPLYSAYVIVSGSMEPSIHVQDAIYLGIMVTHRIIGTDVNERGEKVYVFKGDANYSADQLAVEYDQIYGKVIMRIPKLGYIQYFLSSAYGWIIAIVVPCVGIITYDIMKLIMTSKLIKKRRGIKNEK